MAAVSEKPEVKEPVTVAASVFDGEEIKVSPPPLQSSSPKVYSGINKPSLVDQHWLCATPSQRTWRHCEIVQRG